MCAAILCLESAGTLCSVAVSNGAKSCFLLSEPQQKHTEVLQGMILAALKEADLPVSDVDAIAFGNGPGAFTGIRVACGFAQGMSWASETPLIPLCTLYALAFRFLHTVNENDRILVATDARMHECYAAVYEKKDDDFIEVLPPSLVKPEEIVALAQQYATRFACGNAFGVYEQEIGATHLFQSPDTPDTSTGADYPEILSTEDLNAQMLKAPADLALRRGDVRNCEDVAPLYVRNHVAMTIQERKEKNLL